MDDVLAQVNELSADQLAEVFDPIDDAVFIAHIIF